MRIQRIELNNFKRFTHLVVEDIPQTAKLVVMVGPNGSGKTSFMEAFNHYYKYSGFANVGDYHYLSKTGNEDYFSNSQWYQRALELVDISFHDKKFPNNLGNNNDIKGHFYFRSAYRNEPEFKINSMRRLQNPTESIRLESLNQNDQVVSTNYQRLVADTISGLYNKTNDTKFVVDLRDELTGTLRSAIKRIFDDLEFTSGEKSAFDLILDIVVESKYYPDAIYCIDEPEAHMHTKLQGKVLRELYSLIPEQSQLWLSTHSIGMLQEAEEIEKEYPSTVVFLDFGERDFDIDQIIRPSKVGKAVKDKFYELAFGDFAKLILPKIIVFCEGDPNGNKRKDFDKSIYTTIFANTHPEAFFISGGSCNDIENIEKNSGEIIRTLLKNARVIKLIDGDDHSQQEILDYADRGITVLKERNLESYMFDDEVIKKLCEANGKPEEYEECIREKKEALATSIDKKNATDDYKSARGEIYNALKHRLGLTKCGNNSDLFIRDTLAHLITPDMEVYKRLEAEIFGQKNGGGAN